MSIDNWMTAPLSLWLVLAVFLGIMEVVSSGFFVIFFAVGAVLAGLSSLLTSSLLVQTGVFVGSALVMAVLFRPMLKQALKLGEKPSKPSNVAALMGTTVLVLEEVGAYQGRVKVLHNGEVWSAYLANAQPEETLVEGQTGQILRIDGAKLVIEGSSNTPLAP